MPTPRPRRHAAQYPALLAAAALGAALVTASGCGPDDSLDPGRLVQGITQVKPADAGTPQPQPGDFLGGAPRMETLPDGGVP